MSSPSPATPHTSLYDVAVVGTGPGGSAAALALARGGLRVVMVEKATLPRYKTCGGGLLGRTLDALPVEVRGVIERECRAAELWHHGPALTFATERERPVVSMVMRDRFDHLLTQAAQAAGAALLTGTVVKDVVVRAEAVDLHTAGGVVGTRFVIAADGVMSTVARALAYPALQDVVPALECEVPVDAATWARFGAARFDFGLTPHGYGWVFPKKAHLSIGVLTTRRGSCNLHEEYARYLKELGVVPTGREERHGYMIPLRPRAGLFARPRVLLVGDAAGLADPVTAEGISAAIVSGQLAARAVLGGARDGDPGAVQRAYRRSLQAALLTDLRVARGLARVLYHWPRVRAWAFARHGRRLSEFMTRVVMGETGYARALGRPGNILALLRRSRLDRAG